MIVRMTGIIREILEGRAILERDGIGYEVLVCGYAINELLANQGQTVTLHTMEYLEATGGAGNHYIPRLVGFVHTEDRAFFERFITVKGMGVRKAIKALNLPTASVAAAIENGDAKVLGQLPGIGKRAAAQIIAELQGKVAPFAVGAEPITPRPQSGQNWSREQCDALEVLIALGEKRNEAEHWLDRAIQHHPGSAEVDEWVRRAYRIRSASKG